MHVMVMDKLISITFLGFTLQSTSSIKYCIHNVQSLICFIYAGGILPKYGKEKLSEIIRLKAPGQKLKEGDEHYEAVQKFAQEVVLLIQTVNDNETWAALEYMNGPKFSKDQQFPKTVNFGKSKVRLGMFSQHKAALVQTGMGGNCEKKLRDALSELPNVKGIIALGIAWGCKGKCELGDVLVATKIVGWNEEKWSNGKLIARDRFYEPMTDKFKEVFADLPGQWTNFKRTENVTSKAQKALIISTVKLINDDEIRRQVVDQEPEARGGEMEGHVLVQKIQKDKPGLHVALIKGVSDFADGNKHDEWQLTAAMAAVDYAKYMLDETDPDDLFD